MPTLLTETVVLGPRHHYQSRPVFLAQQTESLVLRLQRPTTDGPVVDWPDVTRLGITMTVDADGELYHYRDADQGGIRVLPLRRGGSELVESTIAWTLPWGFFGAQAGLPRRLGEHRRALRATVQLTVLEGPGATIPLELLSTSAPAPRIPAHSSVAFDAATGASSTTESTSISLTHTAAGTDRAAFIGAHTDYTTSRGNHSAVYAGNAATEIWDVAGAYAGVTLSGYYVLQANVPTGAQTVTVSWTGASGWGGIRDMGVISMTGVHQTTPVGTHQTTAATTGTTPSVTVAGTTSDGLVVDYMGLWIVEGASVTAGADQTQRINSIINDSPGYDTGGRASTQPGSAGGVMSWTKGSNYDYQLGAVEFKASVAGGVSIAALRRANHLVGSGYVS